jgi:RNA polymerase sigma-32 factor
MDKKKKKKAVKAIEKKANNKDLPRASDNSFFKYLKQIQQFPILTPEEEKEYAIRFAEKQDKKAGEKLIQSHLRLVVKMASKFRNYGLSTSDLVSEGNLGLIQALKKFDPRKGFRFSTYSMWWIRAYIQDYILKSWSLVKIGTTVAQKKLFFNLNKIKKRLGIKTVDGNALNQYQIHRIAEDLNVSEKEVREMDSRLSQGDSSLNNSISNENGESKELGDLLESKDPTPEAIAIDNQDLNLKQQIFYKAFENLNDREKDILNKRQLAEKAMTLEDLSQIYKVSRERIRQIEENAIKKIKKEAAKIQNF